AVRVLLGLEPAKDTHQYLVTCPPVVRQST
ncbi:MAG: hypothetical protein K0S49_1670, partial [Microbacterium sp.]|nr:hypothetical protein [Microbacterium sp.]